VEKCGVLLDLLLILFAGYAQIRNPRYLAEDVSSGSGEPGLPRVFPLAIFAQRY
jgi:hypothetical protein